jgi:hypothetical protein
MTVKELYEKVVNGIIISDIELQRAIVYDADKQALVIDSIYNGIPLPAFYLWQREDGKLEVLDGKQRIEAIKKFKQGNLLYEGKTWRAYAYDSDLQQVVDNTELTTIICSGTEEKKREIFNRINTLGVALSKFEVLNGLYHGNYIEGLNEYFAHDANVRKVLPNATVDRGDNKFHLLEYIYYVRYNRVFPKRSELHNYVQQHKDESFNEDFKKIKPYISFIRDVFGDEFNKLIFSLSDLSLSINSLIFSFSFLLLLFLIFFISVVFLFVLKLFVDLFLSMNLLLLFLSTLFINCDGLLLVDFLPIFLLQLFLVSFILL